MDESILAQSYPNYTFEDRSVEIHAIPGWVWWMMILLIIAPLLVYILLWGFADLAKTEWDWLLITLVFLLIHEGTHAVAWKLASNLPWRVFSFGIQWKTVTPYCHCKEPMPVRAYRIGAVMPLIIVGIVPWVISLFGGFPELATASALLISGAGGDIYILWSIRDLPDEVLVLDHDTQAGCVVLWPS